ncbi:MAG: glycerol kinase GlpK [Clostridia bacterium]|nr:glycerol kinase GlpK [Clostridia bacterium]
MSRYIMSLDCGTTSSRCIIFDGRKIIASAQNEYRQIYPQPGWVEHNPNDIWESQYGAAQTALDRAELTADDIAAIGITNQRETTILWDRKTGQPIYNAIVWQCRRTADICAALRKRGLENMIRKKTGLVLDAYFSATKLMWLFDNVKGLRERALKGEIAFGTPDTYLIWRLTGGRVHITDYTNASRTMLFNINSLSWDNDLLREFDIPASILPSVVPSSGIAAYTAPELFGAPIAIAGIAGDQQSALYGQGCFDAGTAKNTYGTGCFLLMNTGEKAVYSNNGLITTIACGKGGKISYALEGSVFSAGAAIQWLRDELHIIASSSESEYEALKVSSTGGVYMVPAFTGLGAPYWDPNARGVIVGITRGTNRRHIIRAVLEAIAYQSHDVLALMEKETGISISTLRVDGGASSNNFLMQFQADISNKSVMRPSCVESTALGAAMLAADAVGIDMGDTESDYDIFNPAMTESERNALIVGWNRAVNSSITKKTDIV